MLERKEYINWYQADFETANWYVVKATVSKWMEWVIRYSINIDFENEQWIKYSYWINSPLSWKVAQELAESIILHFDPSVVPPLPKTKWVLKEFEDWATIKLEKNDEFWEREIILDWKRNSFIRVSNRFVFLDCVIFNLSKKIKLKKLDKKQHIELGMQEWDNFNLYMPQLFPAFKKIEILQKVKNKLAESDNYYRISTSIEGNLDKFTCLALAQCIQFFNDENYSTNIDVFYSSEEEILANKIKKHIPNNMSHVSLEYDKNIL